MRPVLAESPTVTTGFCVPFLSADSLWAAGEALGSDICTARSLHRAAAGLPHRPLMLSAGGGESQGLVCPSPLSAGKLSEISIVLKRKHKASARQKWAQRQLAHQRQCKGKTKKQDAGYLRVTHIPGLVHASRILGSRSVFQAPTFSSSDNQSIVSTG